MEELTNNVYIGDIFKDMGKRTSITEWSPEGIVLMVETLNPKFSEGERILVSYYNYSENRNEFKIIDSDIYGEALIEIGIKQMENEEA